MNVDILSSTYYNYTYKQLSKVNIDYVRKDNKKYKVFNKILLQKQIFTNFWGINLDNKYKQTNNKNNTTT